MRLYVLLAMFIAVFSFGLSSKETMVNDRPNTFSSLQIEEEKVWDEGNYFKTGEDTVIIIINKKYFSPSLRDRLSSVVPSPFYVKFLPMDNIGSIKLSSIRSIILSDLTVWRLQEVCMYTDIAIDYQCYPITSLGEYANLELADVTQIVNMDTRFSINIGNVIGVITTKINSVR